MATNNTPREPRANQSASTKTGNGRARSQAKTFKQTAAAAVNTETIIELVHRLGVVDMAVDRLRARAEDIDFDEIIDRAARYVRRNPEVIVVGLGVATIAAAAIVWLENHMDNDAAFDDDDDEPQLKPTARPARMTQH